MYCANCGKELDQGAAFCSGCGTAVGSTQAAAPRSAPAKTVTVNSRTLLILGMAAVVVIAVLLTVVFLRPGQSAEQSQGPGQSPAMETPVVETDPAAALVGTWTNQDGVGLTFTKDGTLRLSGFGLSLGGDTFHYEVTGENVLTLTAEAASLLSVDTEAPYYLLEDTLFIQIGEFSFELTRK